MRVVVLRDPYNQPKATAGKYRQARDYADGAADSTDDARPVGDDGSEGEWHGAILAERHRITKPVARRPTVLPLKLKCADPTAIRGWPAHQRDMDG